MKRPESLRGRAGRPEWPVMKDAETGDRSRARAAGQSGAKAQRFCVPASPPEGRVVKSAPPALLCEDSASGCMTMAERDSGCIVDSVAVRNASFRYFATKYRMLLTSYIIVGNAVKIYFGLTFRVGLMQGGGMKAQIARKVLHVLFLSCMLCPLPVMAENSYVGSAACKDCHEEQYENFTKFAKKAHSDKSIKIMASDLTEAELAECYACHTTGYGKPGGFVSYEKTPHLADAGCEVCHGPGRDHVESGGDTTLIKAKLSMEDCQS